MTEKVNMGPLSDLGLNIESCKLANPLALRTRYEYRDLFGVNKAIYITLPRKASNFIILLSVPRTNTRGQGEYPKASLEATSIY